MTFFGDILLKKHLITEDQLLSVLVQQSRSAPNLPRICYEQNLVSKESLLKSLLAHFETGKPWIKCVEELDLLSEDLQIALKNHHKTLCPSLLSSFLQIMGPDKTLKIAEAINQLNIADTDTHDQGQPPGDSVAGYCQVFSLERKGQLESFMHETLQDLRAFSSDQVQASLSYAIDNLRLLESYTSGSHTKHSKRLLLAMIDLIEDLMKHLPSMNEGSVEESISSLQESLDVAWEIRAFIKAGGGENEYWENQVSRDKFLRAIENVEFQKGSIKESEVAIR